MDNKEIILDWEADIDTPAVPVMTEQEIALINKALNKSTPIKTNGCDWCGSCYKCKIEKHRLTCNRCSKCFKCSKKRREASDAI